MRKVIDCRLVFRGEPIAEAIDRLHAARKKGFTHAAVTVTVYTVKQPKAAKPKPALERGVPGRIHLHDAQPGKIRSVD